MFGMDNEGAPRDLYLKGHPALQGRMLFVSVAETHPAAAWMKVNDPVGDFDRIQHLVRQGFLVRTRADADTKEARANDPRHATRRWPAARSSSVPTTRSRIRRSRHTACASPAES